jgi:8-oxo-dGTP pyrophosphatase MutT (NUDIX family)
MASDTEYVLGFAFNDTLTKLALIKMGKNKPIILRNKHNGIGGHLRSGEEPFLAMRREFREECRVDIPFWQNFGLLHVQQATIHLFVARSPEVDDVVEGKIEEGTIELHHPDYLPLSTAMANLPWMIRMSLQKLDNPKVFYKLKELEVHD